MNIRNSWPMAMLALIVMVVLAGFATLPQSPAAAAPLAAPTPVSVTRPSSEASAITFNPFSAQAVAADTTSTCFDVSKFAVIDALYSIDQGDTNTVTLTTKWSIDGTTTASGVALVSANAADATEMQQLQVFGKYFCVLADVANTNPVTITVQAIAK